MNIEYETNKKTIARLAHQRDYEDLTLEQAMEIGEKLTDLMIRQAELEATFAGEDGCFNVLDAD